MSNYTFGANLIENLTTGLYKNALNTFREYIQNSCDAIDKAIYAGTMQREEGKIEITIEPDKRRIIIEDNGTGISTKYFRRIMTDIASSDKNLQTDRGFRGIGRLCGLAYCRELVFRSTAKGDDKESMLIFDAEKLRSRFYGEKKYTAAQVLDEIISFDTIHADTDEHFFKVELIDIAETNKDLLDVEKVREYLSFVAPVEYINNFVTLFKGQEIYQHAKELGFKIDEYRIFVNGEPVVKPYKTNYKTSLGSNEIFDLYFRDFYDADNNLIAWSWIGLSTFKGVIEQTKENPNNKMRGIRLRAGNIQIGDENALRDLFKEDRGTTYFIGEVYAVDKNLIPNSQRDYFVENDARNIFEAKLREYFEELHKLYHGAADIRSAFREKNKPIIAEQIFSQHPLEYQKKHKVEHDEEIVSLTKKAASADKKINKRIDEARGKADSSFWLKVYQRTIDEAKKIPTDPPEELNPIRGGTDNSVTPQKKFPPSGWSREKKKLYAEIYEVIIKNPKLAGEKLLDKIKEELTK